MKRFFGSLVDENIVFDEDEAVHIRQVLRMQVGDEIIGIVNDKYNYECVLTEITKNRVVAKIKNKVVCPANPNKNIVLFQAMPKREYFETIVTKAIELGVSEIIPFKSKYSVNHDFKEERIKTIVKTACKQCERSLLPNVSKVVGFNDVLEKLGNFDIVLFANEKETESFKIEELNSYKNIAVIVGNEGGFCDEEILQIKNSNAKSISLGKRILRCDTAAVTMLALTNVLSGN